MRLFKFTFCIVGFLILAGCWTQPRTVEPRQTLEFVKRNDIETKCRDQYNEIACRCVAAGLEINLSVTGFYELNKAARDLTAQTPIIEMGARTILNSQLDRQKCGDISRVCGVAICPWVPPPPSPEKHLFPDEPSEFYELYLEDLADGSQRQVACLRETDGKVCISRVAAARKFSEIARYWLLQGDSELASLELECSDHSDFLNSEPESKCRDFVYEGNLRPGNLDMAMQYWGNSVSWGSPFGAQASIMAQHRLQAHTVQCPVDMQSLSRISRDTSDIFLSRTPDAVEGGRGPIRGEVISLRIRQSALAAVGYYVGEVDGQYGPSTRDAVRGLQRELGYDETGSLSPRQTTHLICHAAQTARDSKIQNVLGIMHAMGLGVQQNTDLSLEWLETAARRGDADANFNLALIYGTGAVFASYRLCGIVESPERADAYLREAARLGHPAAKWIRQNSSVKDMKPRARWENINADIIRRAISHDDGSDMLDDWIDIITRHFPPVDQGCLDTPYK